MKIAIRFALVLSLSLPVPSFCSCFRLTEKICISDEEMETCMSENKKNIFLGCCPAVYCCGLLSFSACFSIGLIPTFFAKRLIFNPGYDQGLKNTQAIWRASTTTLSKSFVEDPPWLDVALSWFGTGYGPKLKRD